MSKALGESSLGCTTPTSSASPRVSKKREKTVPHYLRASTGSCHDLCKYGHKNPSEEEQRFSGGRRKKLPTHLNNLTLHKSAFLDRPKDVRSRRLSLAKSSISLSEPERVASKLTSGIRKGSASNEHLVLLTTTSAEHKILNSDGSKKHSMVAEKTPTNLRHSNGVPKHDRKEAFPHQTATNSAKVKVPEKALPEKSRTVDKVPTAKHSLLKSPTSSSTDLNMIKKVPLTSQASSHHLLSSKDKSTPKGKVSSPSAASTRVCGKPGRNPTRSSNANRSSDLSMPSYSMESKLTASADVQEDLHVTCYSVESIPAEPSSDVTECVGNSLPAPEESSKSISDYGMLGSTEKSETLACEASMEGDTAIELQQSSDDKEFNVVPHEPPEHKLEEHNVMDGRDLKDEGSQTDDDALCQLPEEFTTVEDTDIYDPVLAQSNSKNEDDHVKVNVCADSLNADVKEEVGVHEDLQRSVEALALDESPEHKLEEQNAMDRRALKDENNKKDDDALCQLLKDFTTVENADVYDPVTQSNSKIEDDRIKVNVCFESLNDDSKEEVGVHEDLQRSVETLTLDEKHIKESESCLDFASGNATENDKAEEVLDNRTDNCASYCNSISETSLDGENLEEPNPMLIEPSDSTAQIAALASVSNENVELEGLKSRITIPQLPEELSDDEFYEEYDFEFSESDESGTEDGEASVNGIRAEFVKASDQRLRRIAALQLDDASATPYKLKFKRGKIVELAPDSSGPRRLKFRRKAANEVLNSQSQSARRIYKRDNTNNVVPANPDVESSGVKLRHQDAQGKKDAQGLFNNVIEETASKLVESRKSKVKALVGAFETVISLQDGKPTSEAGNLQDSVHGGEENAPEECQ